jgi:hypothetical protein
MLPLDFGHGYNTSGFQRMETALLHLGWQHAETSAFVYNQSDAQDDAAALVQIWQGIAVVGRATASVGGRLSALSYTIQYIDPNELGRTQFGTWQPANAYDHLRVQVFPGDNQPGPT